MLTPAAAQRIRLTGFYRKTRHAILYSFDPSTYQSLYVNAASQQNYGLEAEADYRFGKWSLRVNYTYTDGATCSAYDGTGAPPGKDTSYFNLYRIPRHAGNLALSWSPVKPSGWRPGCGWFQNGRIYLWSQPRSAGRLWGR